jgi:hypothetical protein
MYGMPHFKGALSSTTMRRVLIPRAIHNSVNYLKRQFETALFASISADGWSQGGSAKRHYLGVRALVAFQRFDLTFELRHFTLYFGAIHALSKTGRFQGKLIKRILDDWGFKAPQLTSCTTDGASDAKRGSRWLATHGFQPLVCFAHAISLVIADNTAIIAGPLQETGKVMYAYSNSTMLHELAELAQQASEPGACSHTWLPSLCVCFHCLCCTDDLVMCLSC